WRWPDTTTSSTPWERCPRSPPPRRTSTRRRWPPAWPPSPGPRAASTSPASRAASRSWTTTRTTRARSPPPSRPPGPSSRRSSVLVVFQPHLFSRTRDFAADFAAALSGADRASVMPVYAAREDPDPSIDATTITDLVAGTVVAALTAAEQVAPQVAAAARPGDL